MWDFAENTLGLSPITLSLVMPMSPNARWQWSTTAATCGADGQLIFQQNQPDESKIAEKLGTIGKW